MDYQQRELSAEVVKVTLVGRFDVAGALSVEQPLLRTAESRKLVLLDLAKVTFLGSMGLRILLLMVRTLNSHGGKLTLLSPQVEVSRVLELSGLQTLVGGVEGESRAPGA